MIKKFFIILFILGICQIGWTADYYIDPDAAGGGDGSYGTPWNEFSDITGMSSGDDIYLKYGTVIYEPLTVTWTGLIGNHSKIGCYDGNGDFDCTGKTLPVIDGSATVTGGWTQHATNEYYTTISEEVYAVFQDDTWIWLAWEEGRSDADGTSSDAHEIIENGIDTWSGYSAAQIEGADVTWMWNAWARVRGRVDEYDDPNNKIELVVDDKRGGYTDYSWSPYSFGNKELFLDSPNEWFYCSSTYTSEACATGDNRLYVYQTGGGSPSGVITYTKLESGISITDKDYIDIQDLEIRKFYRSGIYMHESDNVVIGSSIADKVYIHHIGSQKYVIGESDYLGYGNGISMNKSDPVSGDEAHFENDAFTVKYTKIEHCTNAGIFFKYYTNVQINDNNVSNIGTDNLDTANFYGPRLGAGIYGYGNWTQGIGTIEDNVISYTGYIGISASDAAGSKDTALIDNNTVSNFLMGLHDGGGIYSGGSNGYITISNNIISTCIWDSQSNQYGIYLDAGNNGNTVTLNTIDATGCNACLFNHRGGHNTWTYNDCTNGNVGLSVKQWETDTTPNADGYRDIHSLVIQNNTFDSVDAWRHIVLNAEVDTEIPEDDWFDAKSDMDNNEYCDDEGTMFRRRINDVWSNYNLADWITATGLDANSTINCPSFDINDTTCDDGDATTWCIQTSDTEITNADCGGTCSGGDTIYIEGGARGDLKINGLDGLGTYITIINDPTTRVVMTENSGLNGVLQIDSSSYLDIRGDGKTGHAWNAGCVAESCYGIELTTAGDAGSGQINVIGNSDNIKISYIEIDMSGDTSGSEVGIQVQWAAGASTDILSNYEIHHNYIHDTPYSAMYLGNNNPSSNNDPFVADFLIHHNLMEDLGSYGMTFKGISSTNTLSEIYNNFVLPSNRASGNSTYLVYSGGANAGHGIGVSDTYAEPVKVYKNWVEKTYSAGIRIRATNPTNVEIFNNVVVGCGTGNDADWSHGILMTNGGETTTGPQVYNNTIVEAVRYGIYGDTAGTLTSGDHYDNLIVEAVLGEYGGDVDFAEGSANFANTYIADADNVGFITWSDDSDYSNDDFDLAEGHSVNQTGDTTLADDYDGISRPQGAISEDGAYEMDSPASSGILTIHGGRIAGGRPN